MANKKITQGKWYVNSSNWHDVYIEDGYRIAEVWSGEGNETREDILKQEANTELIALAGNLAQKYNLEAFEACVEALKEALSEIPKSISGHHNSTYILVKSALNKVSDDSH